MRFSVRKLLIRQIRTNRVSGVNWTIDDDDDALSQAKLRTPTVIVISPPTRRSGLTLVEVLVVIAVIGLLLAVAIPAIQFARETARRLFCQNNLKQLGMAIGLYHETSRCIPVSVSPWSEGPAPWPVRNGQGWIVAVLPHIDQHSLYENLVQTDSGVFFSGNGLRNQACRPFLRHHLTTLGCPSDSSPGGTSRNQSELQDIEVALTNYKGVIGDTQLGGNNSIHSGSLPDTHQSTSCNGLFFRNSYQAPQSLSLVTDGLSNTFMLGEDVPEENNRSAAYYANGDWASCHAPPNYFPHPSTPNDWWNVVSFRSRHPNGLYFCFADGSVRFVAESISHTAYRNQSTKDGGDVPSY